MSASSASDWRQRELNQVIVDLCALEIARDAARQLLFRRHLQASVRWTSPLLLDALPPALLERALQLLAPPSSWPETPMPCGIADPFLRVKHPAAANVRDLRRFMNRFTRVGAVLRQPTHTEGGLAIRVAGADLEVAFSFGQSVMATRRGATRIEIPRELPEGVRLGAVGRPVCDVLGHELLDGRDYRITRTTSAPGLTSFEVRTGREPFEMPWPDLVRDRS